MNSVGLIVSHESTGVSYRWLKSARTLLRIVQLTFRYLDQIRLDVIESGVLVQHLYRCWWIVIGSGTSTAFSRWFKASSLWLIWDSATALHISALHCQQLLLTDFGYSLQLRWDLLIHQDGGVTASSVWLLIQDGDVSALRISEVFSQEKHPSTDWSFHLLAFNRSLLRHLVRPVDILVCFLPPFSISWLISLLHEIPSWSYPNIFLPFFPAFYHPNHLINLSNIFLINRLPIISPILFPSS